jgi:hypothetical protein
MKKHSVIFQPSNKNKHLLSRWLSVAMQRVMQFLRLSVLLFASVFATVMANAQGQFPTLSISIEPNNPTEGQSVFMTVTQAGPSCTFTSGSAPNPIIENYEVRYQIGNPFQAPGDSCSKRVSLGQLPRGSYIVIVSNFSFGTEARLPFTVSAVGQTTAVPSIGFIGLLLLALGIAFVGIKHKRNTTLLVLVALAFAGGGGHTTKPFARLRTNR